MSSLLFGARPHRRRGAKASLSLGLVSALASAALMLVSGSPASASHDPSAAPVLNVTKIGFGSEDNIYDFTISPTLAPADGAGAFTVADEATVRFPGLTAGQEYTITETTLGVTPDDITCSHPGSIVFGASVTFTPDAGEVVNCTFTNADGPGNGDTPPEVNITKIVEVGPPGTVFDFTLEGAATTPFSLQDLGTQSFVNPAPRPGTDDFVITETLPPNWVLEQLQCGVGDVSLVPGDGVVTITVGAPGPGEYINCTITNRFVPPPPVENGSLTVKVVGGDPTFDLAPDPLDVAPFTLDPGESVTFDGLPAGEYTLTMTDLEDGLVLDAIDCDPEEISFETVGDPSVTFAVVDGAPITCTFTVSEVDDDDPYDTYDDDPGDSGFDFDTPFDNAGDPASPAPTGDVAAINAGVTQQPQPSGEQLAVAGDTASQPAPAGDNAPTALDQLPRTGATVAPLTMLSGLLLILGGLTSVLGRRRKAPQA
jgi:LPXTG-motif cell wall-anchored protein